MRTAQIEDAVGRRVEGGRSRPSDRKGDARARNSRRRGDWWGSGVAIVTSKRRTVQSYIHTTCEYFKRADSFRFSKQRYRSPSMTYYFVHVGVSGIPDVVHLMWQQRRQYQSHLAQY